MDFKGIYYGNNNVRKYYEFGAHFSYLELCKKLQGLILSDKYKFRNRSNENFNKVIYGNPNHNSKNMILSRNNKILYENNPNSQDLNFNKTMHMIKIRNKKENFNSNNNNYINNNYELYNKIKKNEIENHQVKEINDIQNNNLSRNKIINYIYKQNTENVNKTNINNNYIHLKVNSVDNNISNLINYNLNNKSRNYNFNYIPNYLKTFEDRINNILINSREKNYCKNDILFNKTMYNKNEKLTSPNFNNNKLSNIYIPSSVYINKNFINYKIHQNKFNSGGNIFNKNIEYIHNYNIFK